MSRTIETWHYLFIAVLALAAGSESLPERVARAYESGLQRLFTDENWPPHVRPDVAELRSQLKAIVPPALHLSGERIKAAFMEADPIIVRSIARSTVLLYRKLMEGGDR